MQIIQFAIIVGSVLGGLWLLSKFAPSPVVAVACIVLLAGGNGIVQMCAFAAFCATLADIFGKRRVKGEEGLVPCPTCGRMVSPDSAICPRCETRLPGDKNSADTIQI